MSGKETTYASTHTLTTRELTARPQLPSEIFREHEARLIGDLARMAALDGRRFVDWPTITLATDYDRNYLRDTWAIRAEVKAR